jgi:hypothetical protein
LSKFDREELGKRTNHIWMFETDFGKQILESYLYNLKVVHKAKDGPIRKTKLLCHFK